MSFQDKVVYQIYPKSFMDSNGDGLGDVRGIISKLDYLQRLGVDYLWLTPIFISPQNDNGYDVADYDQIDPRYGTMEDVEEMIAQAKKRKIDIMFDMVFNHTSTENKWFKEALNGNKKYKDFYIFKKSTDGNPPTNWVSKFGGNAWEYVKELDEYYLHLFHVTQADTNWENHELRKELQDVVKFWMKKGVKGFRFDVINLISKAAYENDYEGDGRRFYTDGPQVHKYLKELNKESFGKDEDCVTVGEMSSTTIENCVKYAGAHEHELSMVFSFHHLKVDYKDQDKWQLMPFDFQALKALLIKWQVGMQEANAWNALFLCNHDQPRALSRFGDDKNYPKESAKMLATTMHFMRGTPYIYQGEEIGMTNAYFNSIDQYKDIESLNYFKILKDKGLTEDEVYHILNERSRDNARTPMQWDDSPNAGFTTGTPWIEVNKNYPEVNAAKNLQDKNSIFEHYHKLIHLRKKHEVIAIGKFKPLLEKHEQVFAYERILGKERLLVISNFYGKETECDLDLDLNGYICLLSNYEVRKLSKTMKLRPYESLVFYYGK